MNRVRLLITLEQYNASGARVQMIKKELEKDTEVSKTNPDKAYGGIREQGQQVDSSV